MFTSWKAKSPFYMTKGLGFLLLGICLLHLIVTDTYKLYIAARYEYILLASSIVMILWGLISWYIAPERKYRHDWTGLAILLIPLVLFSFPPLLMTPSVDANQINALQNRSGEDSFDFSNDEVSNIVKMATESRDDSIGIDESKKRIFLTSDNFYKTLIRLSTKVNDYTGYKVYYTGYVLRDDKTLQANEFTLSRMVMACCIADMAPMGLTMHYKTGDELPAGSWYTIEGTVKTRQFYGRTQPYIEVSKIRTAEPILGYVYP